MKNFLAIYTGTQSSLDKFKSLSEEQRTSKQAEGMKAWMDWANQHAGVIVDQGAPLGKTKRASDSGISDISNAMAGYTIVRAESHVEAAKLFENHPHFAIFPGDGVEIMECLAMPGQAT